MLEIIMQRWFHIALLSSLAFTMAGCSDSTSPPRPTPAALVEKPVPPPPPPPPPPPSQDTTKVATEKQPAPPAPPQTPPAARPSIQLSTGVALAQTGPNGTLMSFSVDYEYSPGEADTSSGQVWVIERAHGASARVPVQLSTQAGHPSLQTLIDRWRPEDGPFQSHLEDRRGNRISESIEMR